jgi:GAF domain-containing protein
VAELETESGLAREVENLKEQQRALADVLRAVARSEGLQPVLDEVLESATRLCEAENGRMWLLEGRLLRAVANGGIDEGWAHDRAHPHPIDDTSAAGRAALTRDVVHIHDVQKDPSYLYAGPKPFRTNLSVPVMRDGELIGVLGLTRRDPRPFTDEQIELVKTFADQAAIAVANVRLIDAIEQQLDEQRAVSDTLRAVAEGGGLQPVLDAIVEAAKRLCHGEHAQLYLIDGDMLRIVSQSLDLPKAYDYAKEHPHLRDRSTVVGRVALSGEAEQIPDVLDDPDYTYEAQEIVGYRALLGVPIAKEGELIGAIAVGRNAPGPFADDLVELVKTFADEAAVAITNARLLDAVERQLEQQQAIANVLRAIALTEGLEAVFQAVVEAATRLCRGDFGALYLAEGDVFRLSTRHRWDPALDQFEREHPHVADRTTAIGRAALTRDVVHIPDVETDPDYAWGGRDIAEYHALLAAPILVEDELIGVIDVTRRAPGAFAEEEVRLIRTFADQAAIAIANARLMDAVEQQLHQQRAISDVFRVVAGSEGLDSVFAAVVEAATRLCSGEYGGLYILENSLFHARSHFGPEHESAAEQFEYEQRHPHTLSRTTLVGRVGLSHDVVHIPNLAADPEYEWPLFMGHRAGLAVPILVDDELIGSIAITREPEPFTGEETKLVKTFADQAAIAIANARLMDAVERQRTELSRFVSPQVAELISSEDGQRMLVGHRAYVSCLFCDLRGFTSFTETAEPEELFEVLREYHSALGELIPRYQGTLEHFAGDGLMVFFNDPLPVEDHELKAVQLALAAQERFGELASFWLKRGHELGLGVGIASGYATLGRIGFEGRYDYGALGTVTNLASRLSTHAEPGQTLIAQRVFAAVEERVEALEVGELELKGFGRLVVAYEVRGVVESGS